MLDRLHKLLCYVLIVTLLNASIQPVYAIPNFSDRDVEVSNPPFLQRMSNSKLDEDQTLFTTTPKTPKKDFVSQFFFNPLKPLIGVVSLVKKGVRFVLENPGKAFAMGLALQAHSVDAGSEFQISQIGCDSLSYAPSVTRSQDGNLIITWDCNQGGDSNVYAKFLSQNRSTLLNETMISQNAFGNQLHPQVILQSDNTLLFVWASDQNGDNDIFRRIYNSIGNPLTNEERVNQNTTGDQSFPAVGPYKDGKVAVAWHSNQWGDYDIVANILYPNRTFGDEFRHNEITTGDQTYPIMENSVTEDPVVAWIGTQDGSEYLYARRLSKNNTSPEYMINQISPGNRNWPSIARSTDGIIHFIWGSTQTGKVDVSKRSFFPNDTALGDEQLVNPNTTATQGSPSILTLPGDFVVAAWNSNQAGPGDYDIFLKVYDKTEEPISNPILVNTDTTNWQIWPALIGLPNKEVFIVWIGNQAGKWHVYGRILDNTTLPSSIYLTPAPASAPVTLPTSRPAPSPRPAPASIFTSAPASSASAPRPAPSPILASSTFTPSSSSAGSLGTSEFSTDLATTLPSSSSSPAMSEESLSSSLNISPSSNTAVIIGSVVGGTVVLLAVGAFVIKVCGFPGGDKTKQPESTPADVEVVKEKEESSSSSLTGSDRMTLTNFTEKMKEKNQDRSQYTNFGIVTGNDSKRRSYEYVDLSTIPASTQAE